MLPPEGNWYVLGDEVQTKGVETAVDIDSGQAREYLVRLTSQAGEILKRHFIDGEYSTRQKAGVDFTTQADEEVDAFLREHIAARFPDTQFLTEETAPDDYSALRDADNLWVIDPLDGTINFSRSHPNFAISVALVNKGIPQLGVVHVPITGDTFWAQSDCPSAYVNDTVLQVSATRDLREAVLGCDWAWGLEKRLNVVRWLEYISTNIRQIKSMGSAVSDLASLANGRIDAYIHSGLKPWDVAASALLIEKAGGTVMTPSGGKWNVFESDILATNGVLSTPLLKLINET
jgi:myo-inositol-1(or 4)-monophosphatase